MRSQHSGEWRLYNIAVRPCKWIKRTMRQRANGISALYLNADIPFAHIEMLIVKS